MPCSNVSDKFYILIILGMMGFFIYWYKDNIFECKQCKNIDYKKNKQSIKKHKKKNKSVSFKIEKKNEILPNDTDNASDVSSLDSLDSSDHAIKSKDDSDIDTLDV